MTAQKADVYVIHCDGDDCEEVYENPWGDTYHEFPWDERKNFYRVGWAHEPEEHREGKDFCSRCAKAVK